jgi:hypothetical protein
VVPVGADCVAAPIDKAVLGVVRQTVVVEAIDTAAGNVVLAEKVVDVGSLPVDTVTTVRPGSEDAAAVVIVESQSNPQRELAAAEKAIDTAGFVHGDWEMSWFESPVDESMARGWRLA